MRNEIMFHFCPGLAHMLASQPHCQINCCMMASSTWLPLDPQKKRGEQVCLNRGESGNETTGMLHGICYKIFDTQQFVCAMTA